MAGSTGSRLMAMLLKALGQRKLCAQTSCGPRVCRIAPVWGARVTWLALFSLHIHVKRQEQV